jgi:hypothetical protein
MQESTWTNFGENASTALDSLASKLFHEKYNLSASHTTQSTFDFPRYTQSLALLTHEFHPDILQAEPSLTFLQSLISETTTPYTNTHLTMTQNLSKKINEKLSTFTESLKFTNQNSYSNSLTSPWPGHNSSLRKYQISLEPLLAYIYEKISYCIHDIKFFFVGNRR